MSCLLISAPHALGVGDPFDQGGALAAEGGAALVVVAGGGDLGLEAALLEQEEVELHRLGRGGLPVGDGSPGNPSFDPRQPEARARVIKGGSYLCASNYCARYRPAARHAQEETLAASHLGFRTVSR